ncbi:hypothetical protein ETU10_05370 [Apibacter muscae]|uniref:sensor histidine kinase n=1 Tax=Apibacter muscae TaxID=2509004 RepID=UPI0011ABA004|nr:ATP-binding protein [Apibacter muscae]TWP24115.1 hypothetical protein ETU10_05370 [Apibacter muscae]
MLKKIYIYACASFITLLACKEKNNYFDRNTKESPKILKYIYNDKNIESAYKDILTAKKNKNIHQLSNIYFQLGYYYLEKNISDSAFYYFNHSKEQSLIENDSSFIGRCLTNMAMIQADEADFLGCEETAVEALKYLSPYKKKDSIPLSSVYNTLAISKTELADYSQAIQYHELAMNFSSNKLSNIILKNNQAVVNAKDHRYDIAINILSTLLKNPILDKNPIEKARVLDNLAYIRWQKYGSNNDIKNELEEALKIRIKENYPLGEMASHFHLAEYFEKDNPYEAINHASKMYKIAIKLDRTEDQLAALQKLIFLDPKSSAKKDYFQTYLTLIDSIQKKRNHAKNQFTLIRYEVEKNKEENALLKAENIQKNYQILKQRIIVFIIILIIFIIIVFFVLWYQKRRQKFNLEKNQEIEKTELKYSKKIHDEVANGIYFLMTEIINSSDIKPSKVINDLENLYHKSRDISHDAEFKMDLKKDYNLILRQMIQTYSSKDTNIILMGNEANIWNGISLEKKEELYYILKELLTNMRKHSRASLVTIKFKNDKNSFTIEYIDNGIGMNQQDYNPNKHFVNLKARINSINGSYLIDFSRNMGFYIKILINN